MPTRDQIVACARQWLGTPYQHQASLCGHGADCLGLVRGVYRALYAREPETVPAYTPDWGEESGEETLRDAARRHLVEIDLDQADRGDVVLFRILPERPAKHAAILSAPRRMIHAYSGRAVCENHLSAWWRRRLAYAFQFPGVQA